MASGSTGHMAWIGLSFLPHTPPLPAVPTFVFSFVVSWLL